MPHAMKNKRRLVVLSVWMISMASALGALTYGCSDDKTSTFNDKDSGSGETDSGGGQTEDSFVPPQDSGNNSKGTVVAQIKATSDASTVNGTATFTEDTPGTVKVVVDIKNGFPPGDPGLRGLHIHQNGNCDATDAGPGMGAGPHWNPTDAGHGYPTVPGHHLGDMGNMTIGDSGAGVYTFTSTEWTLAADAATSVVGHSVIYHQLTDDGTTPNTGNAGARVGCGIIVRQ
jgi:Cu-Zn family superoxide dismutase